MSVRPSAAEDTAQTATAAKENPCAWPGGAMQSQDYMTKLQRPQQHGSNNLMQKVVNQQQAARFTK